MLYILCILFSASFFKFYYYYQWFDSPVLFYVNSDILFLCIFIKFFILFCIYFPHVFMFILHTTIILFYTFLCEGLDVCNFFVLKQIKLIIIIIITVWLLRLWSVPFQ